MTPMHPAPRLILTLALAAAAVPAVAAQQTQPSTQAVDAGTPRGALRALNHAMRSGDEGAIKQLFLATTPAEARMIDADAKMAAALAHLRVAAAAAYGSQGADAVTGDSDTGAAEGAARIDAADISVDGDTATVTYRDEKNAAFVLKRVEGRWKVPAAQLGKPLDPAALDQRLADLALQRQVVEEVTDQIKQRKFAGAEQAREAWRARILQAATSQPTTRADRRAP